MLKTVEVLLNNKLQLGYFIINKLSLTNSYMLTLIKSYLWLFHVLLTTRLVIRRYCRYIMKLQFGVKEIMNPISRIIKHRE